MTWTWRDRCGWPVERIKGRPITNFIRILLHTDIGWTLWHDRRIAVMKKALPIVQQRLEAAIVRDLNDGCYSTPSCLSGSLSGKPYRVRGADRWKDRP